MSKIVIYSDFPWKYNKRNAGTKIKGAGGHYDLMTDKQALEFHKLFGDVCKEENVAFFMWGVHPKTPLAMKCIEQMKGFRFATLAFMWVKVNKTDNKIFKGVGNYSASNSEPVWLAVKGSMPPLQKLVPQIILEPKSEHSRKPEETRTRILQMYPQADRYIEFFGREKVNGFEVYGNHLTGNDIFDDVRKLF